jgi:hypothetical protein
MSLWAMTAEIGDPEGTRTVLAIVALLVVMGLGLIMLAVWLRRSTRPDPEFLAPLELMGERSWRRGDPVWQRRRLDQVRPADAEPIRRAAEPPRVDEAFDAGPSDIGFDDLRHHGIVSADAPGRVLADDVPAPAEADTVPEADGDRHQPIDEHVDERVDDQADPGGEVPDTDGDDVLGHTPIATRRPLLDELPPDGVDPELVRRAMEELDAELRGRSNRP